MWCLQYISMLLQNLMSKASYNRKRESMREENGNRQAHIAQEQQ